MIRGVREFVREKFNDGNFELSLILTFILFSISTNLILHILPYAGLNADVAMYVQAGQLILEGKVPFRDFWEINPPLIMYLSVVPAFILKISNLSAELVIDLLTLAFICLGAVQICLSDYGKNYCRLMLLLNGYVFSSWLAAASLYFAEREHLFAIAFIPYLTLRWKASETRTRLVSASILICSLMACLKPSFLLMLLFSEVLIYAQTKKLNWPYFVSLLTPPVLYSLLFLSWPASVQRAFWEHFYFVMSGYSTYSESSWLAVFYAWKLYFLFCPIFFASLLMPDYGLGKIYRFPRCIGLLAILAFVLACIPKKAWAYHLLVLDALICTGGMVFIDMIIRSELHSRSKKLLWPAAMLLLIGSLYWGSLHTLSEHPRRYFSPTWVAFLNSQFDSVHSGAKVAIFGADPYLIYPMLLEHHLMPGTRYLSIYPLAFFNNTENRRLGHKNPSLVKLDPPEKVFVDQIHDDLIKNKPELIIFPINAGFMLPRGFSAIEYAKAVGWYDLLKSDYKVVSENQNGTVLRLVSASK